MASDEQFSLCWNNFHANMSAGFHGLLSRGDLVDVTLAAEGRLLQAHKLVLSVCSPYFQEMFKMNPTQHPIVFLKDVSHSALRDLLQFMYQGEVNVKQEELASFISTAEQLQVKGLTGNQNEESSTPSKPKPTSRPGPRSSQQRQSVMTKLETDLDSKPSSTPVAIKRPNRPSIASNNSSSSQSGPVKRKCVDPLEAGPSGSAKEEFVTIPDEDENNAVAPKMEPEFVNESMWDDDDDGTNNDETNFGEDDSNMEMTGFDGSTTGDGNLTGGAEGGAVGDAQDHKRWIGTRRKMSLEEKRERKKLAERARLARIKSDPILLEQYREKSRQSYYRAKAEGRKVPIREMPPRVQKRLRRRNKESASKYRKKIKNNIVIKSVSSLVFSEEEIITP
ncbi:protein tramtrack, beta isoform isoform X11 [Cydia splendana]|uniref:protein tramtrack, beta isoform isoform X11 n=1 Tax=Cydia splendana TaxID=1100963 RepID=UPI00300C4549